MRARPAVIWDIDGVLADCSRRIARLNEGCTWDEFHRDQCDDPVNPGWAAVCRALEPSHCTIMLTNRSERYRAVTSKWLADNDLGYDSLLMRALNLPGDRTSKMKHVRDLANNRYLIVRFAVDDDPGHEIMFTSLGIPFVYAHSGFYDREYIKMAAED